MKKYVILFCLLLAVLVCAQPVIRGRGTVSVVSGSAWPEQDPYQANWVTAHFFTNHAGYIVDETGYHDDSFLLNVSWDSDTNALLFDGSSAYIKIEEDAGGTLSFVSGGNDIAFSVSAWVTSRDVTDWQVWFGRRTSTTAIEYHFQFHNPGHSWAGLFDNSSANSISQNSGDNDVTNNIWYLQTVTYNGNGANSDITLYRDNMDIGANDGGGTYVDMHFQDAANAYVGFGSGSSHWNGYIDNVRVWRRELTATEVTNLYDGGRSAVMGVISTNDMVLYYPMSFETHRTLDAAIGNLIYGNIHGNTSRESGWTASDGTTAAHRTFDGIDDEIQFDDGNTNALDLTNNFSISSWAKMDSFPSGDAWAVQYFYSRWLTTGDNRQIGMGLVNTNSVSDSINRFAVVYAASDGTYSNTLYATTNLSTDTWYHFAAVKDGTNILGYIDGNEVTWSTRYVGNVIPVDFKSQTAASGYIGICGLYPF